MITYPTTVKVSLTNVETQLDWDHAPQAEDPRTTSKLANIGQTLQIFHELIRKSFILGY